MLSALNLTVTLIVERSGMENGTLWIYKQSMTAL